MKLRRQLAWITLISISSLATCAAQSLGDLARQQQAKKSSASQPKHVITNDDIASGAKATDSGPKSTTKKSATPTGAADSAADANRPSAEEITAGIKEQRQKIRDVEAQMKDLQQQLDTWKGSDCTHVLHSDTLANACDDLQKINTDLARTKSQLEQEKKNLATMQEDARKMGFANSVYDPN